MPNLNQTPEQRARDKIDRMLEQAGWLVQDKNKIDFSAGAGIAVREYQTDVGRADYVLFIGNKPVGVVEAKPERWGQNITTVEEQSAVTLPPDSSGVNNSEPLPFVYESTGVLTRFTDARDPRPVPRGVQLRSATDDAGLGRPAGLAPCAASGASGSGRHGSQSVPDYAVRIWKNPCKNDRPRALIQMATARARPIPPSPRSTGCSKHADARRVLFLVDTRNLGEQAEQEFMAYVPSDDNRKFTELYNVQRLKSSSVARDSQVASAQSSACTRS